jgi:hypothetical protein
MNPNVPIALLDYVEHLLSELPAGMGRKQQVREELLAHLVAVFDQELSRGYDQDQAAAIALARFGGYESLRADLTESVPRREQWLHHLCGRMENLMKWLFLILGVFGILIGAGFICPAVAKLLYDGGLVDRPDFTQPRGEMMALTITLLILGISLALAGVSACLTSVRRFRVRSA